MKKIAVIVLIVVSLSLFVSLSGCTHRSSVADDCVRIHIRANSNSDADQKIKLAVRDEVVNFLTPYLAGCESKTDAEKVIDENKTGIAETALSVLRENGFGYTVSVRLAREKFPFRKYGDIYFPEGVYDAYHRTRHGRRRQLVVRMFSSPVFCPRGRRKRKLQV